MTPSLGLFEVRQSRADRPHRRQQIDRDADRPSGLVVGRAETRGVVDEDVDPAECGCRLVDIARDRGSVGEIAYGGMGDAAVPGNLLTCGRQPLGAARADRHARTRLGKGKRDRPADAPAAAGDDRTLAGKIDLHASSSALRCRSMRRSAERRKGLARPSGHPQFPADSGIAGKKSDFAAVRGRIDGTKLLILAELQRQFPKPLNRGIFPPNSGIFSLNRGRSGEYLCFLLSVACRSMCRSADPRKG